ncbi:MAG: hypothetical protein U1F16_08225 [Turneriella sp.]
MSKAAASRQNHSRENLKLRVARIPEQQLLLNKMGFNNPGFIAGWQNLYQCLAEAPLPVPDCAESRQSCRTPTSRAQPKTTCTALNY